ncbi:ABC transporter permease [Yinghuangia soli]|uniref:ABC-2 family transporter protein n=1 Tax=Yinghuangia soli TaxID=2908204 RepID=A0AA41U0E2_9ACTN|nr:ABC-2 family transporter protein [Yinghuangia soli]MCF2526337.1 ABC-2 family transporter protein [Yinghuangia soli]
MPSAAACPRPGPEPESGSDFGSDTRSDTEPDSGSDKNTRSAPDARPAPIPFRDSARAFAALAGAGFRRHSTYRQATVAGVFTNIVFGIMLCAVYVDVAGASGRPGGYTTAQLVSYVWVGQGLLSVVCIWAWKELAERIRSGDVAADLLRPVDPLAAYAAADLGRAGYAVLTRLLAPLAFGLLFYSMYLPQRAVTYPMFAVSVAAATLVSFAGRYLVNLSGFWLLDIRGPISFWMLILGPLCGGYFPLRFLPEWAQWLVWCATPFPSVFQVPLDIAVERTSSGVAAATVLLQIAWAALLFQACARVQRRAVTRLVVQGG